jgi:hypothetical protein
MKKGYTNSWRKELESDAWLMPPLYHRDWYWLRQKVQYEAFLFPTKKIGIWVLPGQRLTSYAEIAEGFMWYVWGKERVPNKKTVVDILAFLEAQGMIATTSNAKGTLISIVNWHLYNQIECIESNAGETLTGLPYGHKKRRLKKDKEGEEEKTLYGDFVRLTLSQHEKLIEKYGEEEAAAKIERLDNYIGSKGTKYKSHYHTILNWSAKDEPKEEPARKLQIVGGYVVR